MRKPKNILSENTLVLNRLWQAANICSVERAFKLLCLGHAEVVIERKDGVFDTFDLSELGEFSRGYEGKDVVHTSKFAFKVPRVILLLFFDRIIGKDVKFTRNNIYERDDHRCQYCGKQLDKKHLNLDHVIPRDMGGSTKWENIVCSCIECNTKKANRTPMQAGLVLLKKPKKPKWQPFANVSMKNVYHHDWKHFIDIAYWNKVDIGEKPVELIGK